MFNTLKKRITVLAGLACAATFAVLASLGTGQADDVLAVGTYSVEDVAAQSGLQQQMQQEMSGLQIRMQEAQQEGDQAAMQQIQTEAGQIQERIVADFENSLDAAMPAVAEKAGVKIIAADVSYAADDVETRDVTNDIIAEMNGGAAPTPDIPGLQQLPAPQPQ